MPRGISAIILFGVAVLAGCQASTSEAKNTQEFAALYPQGDLTAEQIMRRAHEAAGGEFWVKPESLSMYGYGVFYKDGVAATHETHNMFRVYSPGKTDAHVADGKVRIESIRDGQPVLDMAYDGTQTYINGKALPPSENDKQWSSAFGFGAVRHVFDEGYSLSRDPDDLIDGRPAYMIKVTDPSGALTWFGIAQDDYAVLKVAFDTDRGWHERIYSDFMSKPGIAWNQPGRVRLYYNGIKGNEVIWTDFAVNADLPDCLFTLPQAEYCRDGMDAP